MASWAFGTLAMATLVVTMLRVAHSGAHNIARRTGTPRMTPIVMWGAAALEVAVLMIFLLTWVGIAAGIH